VGKFYFDIRKNTGEISFQKINGRSGKPQHSDEAISSATNFLEKHGMMPADASDPTVNYNSAQSLSPSGELHKDYQTSVINYKREINGLPVYGAAAILEVELVSNEDIIEIHKDWAEYQIQSTRIAKSPDNAFQEFVECANTREIYWDTYPFWPEKVVINQVDLGYVQGIGNESNELKPEYVFWGYGIQGNKTDQFSTSISVSAIDEDSGCQH
jgi:hypothetical protein